MKLSAVARTVLWLIATRWVRLAGDGKLQYKEETTVEDIRRLSAVVGDREPVPAKCYRDLVEGDPSSQEIGRARA